MAKNKNPQSKSLAPLKRPGVSLFEGMAEKDFKALMRPATVVDYPARSWVYRQDEPAREFYLVQSGLIRLSQLTPEGDDVLVRFVAPGEVFGYFALAMSGPNVASAQAVQPSRLAVWNRATAMHLLQTMPRAAVNLFNIAVRDVMYFYTRNRRLLVDPVGNRVKWALAELIRTVGVETPRGIEIALGIGQRELAELASTTIFTVSRELSKLEREGMLEKTRGRIVVLKPAELLKEC